MGERESEESSRDSGKPANNQLVFLRSPNNCSELHRALEPPEADRISCGVKSLQNRNPGVTDGVQAPGIRNLQEFLGQKPRWHDFFFLSKCCEMHRAFLSLHAAANLSLQEGIAGVFPFKPFKSNTFHRYFGSPSKSLKVRGQRQDHPRAVYWHGRNPCGGPYRTAPPPTPCTGAPSSCSWPGLWSQCKPCH